MGYLVHLQQFEGPLGLLLYLIRKEEMDIFDINVNEITHQYLEYIRAMKELDLEVAGEFVAMAATLIHIKSRMLLPSYNEEGEVVESEDPRKELVQKLLDYQRYQEAAKKLYERPLLTRDVFSRGIRENYNLEEELAGIEIEEDGLFSLISAYRKIMRKAQRAVHKVRPKVQSIASRILDLKEKLIVGARVLLRDLVEVGEGPQRARLLITFLSMLELGRMGFVSVFQNEVYGDIYIEPKKPVERNVLERVQEFDAGDAEAVAKSIISEAIEERIDMAETMADENAPTPLPVEGAVQLSLAEANFPTSDSMGLLHELPGIEQMASDDEILAAEMELDRAEGIVIPQAPEVSLSEAEVAAAGDDTLLASELLGDPVYSIEETVSATSVSATEEVAAEFGTAEVVDAPVEAAPLATEEFAEPEMAVAEPAPIEVPIEAAVEMPAEASIEMMGADLTSDTEAFVASEIPAMTEIPTIEEPAQVDEVLSAETNVEAAEAFATETSEMDEAIAMSTEAGPASEMIEASQELAENGPKEEPLVIDQIPESVDMEAFEMAEEKSVDTLLAEMAPVAPTAVESTDAAPVAEPADSAQSDVTASPEAGEIDEEPPTDMTT